MWTDPSPFPGNHLYIFFVRSRPGAVGSHQVQVRALISYSLAEILLPSILKKHSDCPLWTLYCWFSKNLQPLLTIKMKKKKKCMIYFPSCASFLHIPNQSCSWKWCFSLLHLWTKIIPLTFCLRPCLTILMFFFFCLFFLPMYALMRLSYTVLIESPVPFVCININFPLLFYFHAQ